MKKSLLKLLLRTVSLLLSIIIMLQSVDILLLVRVSASPSAGFSMAARTVDARTLELSWTQTGALLESVSSLSAPIGWKRANISTRLEGGRFIAQVPVTAARTFYRLAVPAG